MIYITEEQMKVFSQYQLNLFFGRMEQSLKNKYPEQTIKMAHADLRDLIEQGVERAKEYGIKDQNDVSRFLEYLVMHGQDFGNFPETMWADKFLNDPDLTGSEKMNQIDNYDLFVITLGK